MSDLIQRQDAIEAVYEALRTPLPCYGNNLLQDSMTLAKAIVDNIPSVEPERKKGTWKPDESGNVYWICSVCGFASEAFGADILYHFCPNCGCEMTRGGHE